MIYRSSDLDIKVNEELNKYSPVLENELKLNRPFSYLELIADTYKLSRDVVIDEALDSYNFFVKFHKASSEKALYLSIYDTHRRILLGDIN